MSRAVITSMYAAGSRAHPRVALDLDTFSRFVAPLAPDEHAALHAADLYLACAASRGDPRAIGIIEEAHLARLPAHLASRKLSAAELDEVTQQVRERLFVGRGGAPPKIAEYAGRGPLDAWLRVLALRVATTLRRRARAHEPLDEVAQHELTAASPEHQLARARWQRAFDEALRDAFANLSPEERALFRFQFGKGMTLDQIAVVLDVHRATAARRIAAARERLWRDLTRLLRERLGVAPADLAALLGEWRSKLDVSLSGLLSQSQAGE